MATREYAGAAKRTAITGDITAASTTITVTDATGYPTGATGPFAIALELGAAAEEKVLVASRSGNTLTVDTRGYDGTTAAAHSSGATVDHVLTAIDIREANTHINKAANAHDATAISFTAAAGITATSVQAAIEEVVSDSSAAYVAKADMQVAAVAATETTTSQTFTDLATAGPAVTATTGTRALVIVTGDVQNNTAGAGALMNFAVSGATTRAVNEDENLSLFSAIAGQRAAMAQVTLVTGLTAGSNTFTSKYRVTGNTGSFGRRRIIVIPL